MTLVVFGVSQIAWDNMFNNMIRALCPFRQTEFEKVSSAIRASSALRSGTEETASCSVSLRRACNKRYKYLKFLPQQRLPEKNAVRHARVVQRFSPSRCCARVKPLRPRSTPFAICTTSSGARNHTSRIPAFLLARESERLPAAHRRDLDHVSWTYVERQWRVVRPVRRKPFHPLQGLQRHFAKR